MRKILLPFLLSKIFPLYFKSKAYFLGEAVCDNVYFHFSAQPTGQTHQATALCTYNVMHTHRRKVANDVRGIFLSKHWKISYQTNTHLKDLK